MTAFNPIAPIRGIQSASGATATAAVATGGASSFAATLANALEGVNAAQVNADAVSEAAAAGQADVTDVLVATSEAQLLVQTATTVRNRAVEAFNSIMQMQV
jgi:flagellar hook-basal body complex protein FliE